MKNQQISISKVYHLLNKILNTLVKRKFGKHYSTRLNSLCFISNRTDVCFSKTCFEKITIKSLKPINSKEINLITSFLLFNINSALMCIENDNYIEVVDIELVII